LNSEPLRPLTVTFIDSLDSRLFENRNTWLDGFRKYHRKEAKRRGNLRI
jgi:hypothetical protein